VEIGKQELQAIESAVNASNDVVVELNDLELAVIGGGSGAVSLG
jgi:hypothetical protein